MTTELERLQIIIGADVRELKAGLEEANNRLKGLGNRFKRTTPPVKTLTQEFNHAFRGASSLRTGLAGLGASLGALLNPITAVAVGATALAAGLAKVSSGGIQAAKDIEATINSTAALLNTTLQFKDADGRALDFVQNFAESRKQSARIIEIFLRDVDKLNNVEFDDLKSALTVAAPLLGNIGATSAEDQAKSVELLTTAFKNLKATGTEIEQATEIRAILSGDFGNARSDIGRQLVAQAGSAELLKKQFEAAVESGEGVVFLEQKLGGLVDSAKLASDSLLGLESVLRSNVKAANIDLGRSIAEVQKQLIGGLNAALEGALIDGTFERIGQSLASTFSSIEPLVQPLTKMFFSLGQILADLLQLVGELFRLISPALGALLNDLSPINSLLAAMFSAFVELIALISKFGEALFNAFKKGADEATNATAKAIEGLANWFNQATATLRAWSNNVTQMVESLRFLFSGLFDYIAIGFKLSSVRSIQGLGKVLNDLEVANSKIRVAVLGFQAAMAVSPEVKTDILAADSRNTAPPAAPPPADPASRPAAAAAVEADDVSSTANRIALMQIEEQLLDGRAQLSREIYELEQQLLTTKDAQIRKELEAQIARMRALGDIDLQLEAKREELELLKQQGAGGEEIYRVDLQIKDLLYKRVELQRELTGKIQEAGEATGNLKKKTDESKEAVQTLVGAFESVGGSLGNSISQGVSQGRVEIENLAADIINIFANTVFGAISSSLSSALTGGGGGGSLFGSLLGGNFAQGGIVPGNYAQGGVVYASKGFRPRGTDTVPAMLTPGEMVINRRQQSRLFNMANGHTSGSSQSVNITIHAVDAQGTLKALQQPEVRRYLRGESASAANASWERTRQPGQFSGGRTV